MHGRSAGRIFALHRLWALCLSASVLVPPTASAQPAQEVQKTTEQVTRRLNLQTNLPTEPERPRMTLSLPPEALWVVIAVALGVLIYTFRDMLAFWGKGLRGSWDADDAARDDAARRTPEVVLGAADELAREGRYVEAMHVLLLQALADMRRRLGEFADSLTSREILRHAKLSPAGQGALRDIVERVELTHFGLRPATAADYRACRASFGALAQALRSGGIHESQAE